MTRQQERAKANRRDLVLRLCLAAGGLLALPWALQAWDATPDPCNRKDGICWDQLTDAMWPILGRVGVGLAAGLAVALLLCFTVPGLRRSSA